MPQSDNQTEYHWNCLTFRVLLLSVSEVQAKISGIKGVANKREQLKLG